MSIRSRLLVLLFLAIGFAPATARGQQIHRHAFSNKQPAFVRGDTNLRVEEAEHEITTQSFHSQPSSEHFRLVSEAGTGDAAYIHYFYETPPAPVSETLSAGVWVKATKAGIQFRARVVFPKETDPNHPDDPLTTMLVADTYQDARLWRKLTLSDVPDLLSKHLPLLRTRVGRDVNTQDAYIDRLVLNLYCGPGPVDVWVDDLDIGPVRPKPVVPAPRTRPAVPGTTTGSIKAPDAAIRSHTVAQQSGLLKVDGKPFFPRIIRHSGTPLFALRMAGFNTIWFPPDAASESIEEAARNGFMVIPSVPPLESRNLANGESDTQYVKQEADRYAALFQKFLTGDSVLYWDLGSGYRSEDIRTVENSVRFVHDLPIPRRPLGADVWDAFQSYSLHLDVVGAHRWPLFSSLELYQYREWLTQRRMLTATPKSVFTTWVQTHMPDWYVSLLTGRADTDVFNDPIGPQPEQIRLLTYLSIAVGCRGVGFWSDRYLASTHHGRDRLLGLALLNAELDMLAPVLAGVGTTGSGQTEWVETDNPSVKAAILRGEQGILALPIWFGSGSQYVPGQGATASVKFTVKLVPEGADPWLVSPSGIRCLKTSVRRVPGGVELTIPQFDLVAPVVFTNDLSANGLVVQWQDYNRTHAKLAAQWALDLAKEQYLKVLAVHQKLVGMGVDIKGSEALLKEAQRFYKEGQKDYASEAFERAHQNATWALRPLRLLMRDHWEKATRTLDVPAASPYAVSFYSLPQHWQLAQDVKSGKLGANVLSGGDFESAGPAPKDGLRVDTVPGWSARMGALGSDRVNMAAGIVPAKLLEDLKKPRKALDLPRTTFTPTKKIVPPDEGYLEPAPELGANCIKLEVRSRLELGKDGKVVVNVPILERTFLAVDGPVVELPPGTLVRVSAWVKVPNPIKGTADGMLFYDDACGEPLAVRILHTGTWKHFRLYRRVPASGKISVTLALTGIGVVYADDFRIEPILPAEGEKDRTPPSKGIVSAGGPVPPGRVSPAAFRPGLAPTVPTIPAPKP